MSKLPNFYCITGGPGVGKTNLLNALETRYQVVPEVAREIIKEQMSTGGDALPWKNKTLYTDLMLARSIESYQEVLSMDLNAVFFFDRGVLDTLCYAEMIGYGISPQMDLIARNLRYQSKVFILPPWKAIYTTDNERKQTWEEAVYTYKRMRSIYEKYGYEVIDVPPDTIENRKNFVLAEIGKP